MWNRFLDGMGFGLMCGGAAIGLAACAMVLLMIVSLGVWLYGLAEGGRLCDIVPTMIELMGYEVPKEMTGHSLLIEK